MTKLEAIRNYFGTTRPVTMDELKAFTAEEREALAKECAKALGVELT